MINSKNNDNRSERYIVLNFIKILFCITNDRYKSIDIYIYINTLSDFFLLFIYLTESVRESQVNFLKNRWSMIL